MAQVLDWQQVDDSSEIVRQAAQALADGQLVAFPTETVYGLASSAFLPEAVARLQQSKGRPEKKPLTLAIGSAAEAAEWVPDISPLGRRLARRCWPGPVTLVFGGNSSKLARRLPEAVRQRICPEGTLGLRVPAHDAVLEVMKAMAAPLVLTSANRSGEPPATTAAQVLEAVGEEVALIIDDGPCRFGQASTVVKVDGSSWKVLREGVVSAEMLRQQAARKIVFICTGNTCRSPLAEALCKKHLAERLGCRPEELLERGICVQSAGIAAMIGAEATPEAVEAARALGADLSKHRSRPLSAELASQADYLIAMAHSHLLALEAQFPEVGCPPRLLSPQGEDIADPIGSDQPVYERCAQEISRHLQPLLEELLADD